MKQKAHRQAGFSLRPIESARFAAASHVLVPLAAILSLSACSSQPITVTETIHVPTYLPIPATLTAPVAVDLKPGITYGEALGSLREGLSRCDSQLVGIGVLKSPSPPK